MAGNPRTLPGWQKSRRIAGDASDWDLIVAAAEGVCAILRAVNPPGYKNWAKLVVPMIEYSIAAAKVSGARILLARSLDPFRFILIAVAGG